MTGCSLSRVLRVALGSVLMLSPIAAVDGQEARGAGAVVATGVPRPLELAAEGDSLVVLSPGAGVDVAAEIYRFPLGAGDAPPIDLRRQPRVRIPFVDASGLTLGSLALEPRSGDLYLGEENGTRLWRLSRDEQLTLYATGLSRLAGGSVLAFDRLARLVIVDYADPFLSQPQQGALPGLEQFRDEDYRGPLIYRVALDPSIPLPRRVAHLAPLFPRGWGAGTERKPLPTMISAVAFTPDGLVVLTSNGELRRLGDNGTLAPFTQLPRGQYNRTHMVAATDGTIFVSGGFQVGSVFMVAPGGLVTILAGRLADPEGIAVDGRGHVYVAESALHRIVRFEIPGVAASDAPTHVDRPGAMPRTSPASAPPARGAGGD